jgi:hypothetical protein
MTSTPTDFTNAQPRRRVPDPNIFRQRCAIVGLLFLLVSQFGKLIWYDYTHRTYTFDFNQYYMGGMIARAGAWDSLYPIPIPGSNVNVGYSEGSTLRPRYARRPVRRRPRTIPLYPAASGSAALFAADPVFPACKSLHLDNATDPFLLGNQPSRRHYL